MDFTEAQELFAFWAENPPVRVMVAHYLGFKKPEPESTEAEEQMVTSAPMLPFTALPPALQEAIRQQQQAQKDTPNG